MGIVCQLLSIYFLVIVAGIVLSWFPIAPGTFLEGVASFFFVVTEPVLGPVRRALPPVRIGMVGLDLSPLVVLLGLSVLQRLIC